MKTIGYDKPLYILPYDHRGSFQTKMFGWQGDLTAAQTARRLGKVALLETKSVCTGVL